METLSKVSGGSEALKKAIGAAIWQSEHHKFSNFLACKAQGYQHEIRIAFFERDKTKFQSINQSLQSIVSITGSIKQPVNPSIKQQLLFIHHKE